MNKRITALGLTAGLLAGAGAGFLLESSGSAGAVGNVAVVAAAAGISANSTDTTGTDTTGTDAATRTADRAARLQEILQPLVADGTLTQDQADKVVAAFEAAGPMSRGGHGGGHDGGRGPGGPGMRGGANLDEVATVLGITADELRTSLQGGQTLAEVAVANGKTAQDVIDVLVAGITQHFADEVAAGEHTQADADAKIAEITTRITDMVTNGGPVGGGPGHDDGGPSDTPTTSTGA